MNRPERVHMEQAMLRRTLRLLVRDGHLIRSRGCDGVERYRVAGKPEKQVSFTVFPEVRNAD